MTFFKTSAMAALTAGAIAITSLATPASAGPVSPGLTAISPIVLEQAAVEGEQMKPTEIRHRRWHRRHRRHGRRAAAAGIAGALIGAAIVGAAASRERRAESRWDRHVARCYRRYRSYDEATDTWIDRRGRVRRCRL